MRSTLPAWYIYLHYVSHNCLQDDGELASSTSVKVSVEDMNDQSIVFVYPDCYQPCENVSYSAETNESYIVRIKHRLLLCYDSNEYFVSVHPDRPVVLTYFIVVCFNPSNGTPVSSITKVNICTFEPVFTRSLSFLYNRSKINILYTFYSLICKHSI